MRKYTYRLQESFQQGKLLGNRHAPRTVFGRVYAWMMVLLFLATTAVAVLQPFFPAKAYALDDDARSVLPQPAPEFDKLLKYDASQSAYVFNQGYVPSSGGEESLSSSGPRITAKFYTDVTSKGVVVTDPVNNLDFSMRPDFAAGQPQKDDNQIMYALPDNAGYLVYTAQVDSVKEDILLARYSSDQVSYDFNLELPADVQAKVEKNGSLGLYGSEVPLYGQVTTGSSADAALLQKARQNAPKTKLLANIPAPVVVENHKKVSQIRAHYELDGTQVRIVAEHLKGASFPLAIDPSIYIETAQKLMRGNNETNVDFNTTDELIQKGELTGGRFNNWYNTTNLPANRMSMGTAVGGGYVYVAGGLQSNTRQQTVYWAKFNTTTNTIDAPDPGNGSCNSWCTNSVYNLPVALSNFSMVYYSGFLYVMGGETNTGYSNAVYIAKLGANGEPSLWHPTDPNPANWVYWYTDPSLNLSSARSQFGAAAYENHMYIVGGQTAASGTGSGGITNVEVANINPMGTLGSWSSTGMVQIPTMRRAHNIQIYNDRMYLIGGISNVTPQNTIQYIKLNSDGTMAGSWSSAISMLKARFSEGGSFSTIWGGYLYVAGGCSAVTGTGNWCSVAGLSTANDIELASINTDGSVTNWSTIAGLSFSPARTDYGLVSWRKTLYSIGGCTAPNDTTGVCGTDSNTAQYGPINNAGDVSTTNNSFAPGTSSCSGTNPTNCNIPPAGASAGQIGNMVDGVALNNGYIYLIGGCTVVTATSNCYNKNTGAMSDNVAYAALAVDGSITTPGNCTGTGMTLYGTWCVDSTHTIHSSTGLGAMATTVFNNVLYAIGGTDGGAWSANVYEVSLNSDGSLAGAWTAQSFGSVNLGVARGFAYAYSRANPSSATVDPGVMFVIGGCNNGLKSNGIPCATYYNTVYKCYITPSGAIDATNQCTTTGQIQLDSENDGTGQGLAGMAGTVYAGYMYLIGGTSPNQPARGTVMYARIDDNNNLVAAPGGTGWTTSPNVITPIRERGAAFGYNGFLYSLAGYNSTGTLNDVLYAKINVNDGSIGSFTPSQVTVVPRWGLMSVVANGFVYAMGGCGQGQAPTYCTAMTQTTQTFQLYNNYSGTPAGYTATNALSVDRIGGSAAVLNGYVYFAGGCSDIACTAPQNTVYYAVLNADGTIGTWNASPNALPAARTWGKLVAQGGYLYYMGGQDASGTAQASVYYSQPASGVPGAWGTATNGLPAPVTEIGAAVWNNRLYVTGGSNGGTRQTSIYYSPSIPSGGDITTAWTTNATGFNIARSGHTAITYADNLYIIGGYTGSAYLADVQYAKVASDGSVGSWSYTTSLPQYTYEADGFAANGYMYLFGGRSASTTCSNSAFVSAISANTTIASGNNPTGVGDWSQTNVKFNAARYGAGIAYGDGRAYVLGGGCSAFVGASDRSYATALQSQPAVAKYSRMIDADTDVFPTKWLMNGLDNDIGARWQLKYRSMSNPLVTDPAKMCAQTVMSTWGQEVNYGTVTLGMPDNYIAEDGSGNAIPCARYYFLNVSIDSSKAFGYPDDVTRGPTVDDITLFFTSDPSKRLRHGSTFTGGELQPLDTPF